MLKAYFGDCIVWDNCMAGTTLLF